MTTQDPGKGDDPPQHLVQQAERQLAAYGAELDAAIESIRNGDLTASREWAAIVTSLRKALEAVFSERARLEKLDEGGGGRAGELDLAAAAAEVQRRMDRLRDAADARGIPEGPE